MTVVDVDRDSLLQLIKTPGIVLVDGWAAWCAACRDFEPVYERVAARHPAHTFAKLDTERETEAVESLGITHIPTLLLFRDGLLLLRKPGYFSEEQLEDVVAQSERLDLEQVRSAMAAEQTPVS